MYLLIVLKLPVERRRFAIVGMGPANTAVLGVFFRIHSNIASENHIHQMSVQDSKRFQIDYLVGIGTETGSA